MLADEVNASGCSVDVSSLSIKMLDESASNVSIVIRYYAYSLNVYM